MPKIYAAIGDPLLKVADVPEIRPICYSEEGSDEKNIIGFFIPTNLDGYQAMCDILQVHNDARNSEEESCGES